MSKSRACRLLSIILIIASSVLTFGPAFADPIEGPYVPGEVIIKYSDAATSSQVSALSTQLNSISIWEFSGIGASLERLISLTVPEAIALLENDPLVEYIEPNYLYTISGIPNDPDFPLLWGMHNTGQTGGTVDADIDAPEAWSQFTGSNAVTVAVIDTGVDYNHPDLAANIWTNPGEIANNGIDDDNNGFIDDIHGWDFVNNDGDPMDDHGHGTHVSGTIGGVGDNGVGVAGVNWNVKIMPVKFLSASGSGTTADAIGCVEYATMMGAALSNNSWGGGAFSTPLEDAIRNAYTAGVLFVASAGNSGNNNDLNPTYPSSYNVDNIVSVGATDHNDDRVVTSFWASSFGATTVDIGAPGSDIYSTERNNSYGFKSGTSMAAPHVSGVLALVVGQFPNITVDSAKTLIFNSVDELPQLAGLWVTGGRINAAKALSGPDSIPPFPVADLTVDDTASNWISLVWTASGDDGSVGTASSYDFRYATFPIDATNFDTAISVPNTPFPAPSGQPDTMLVDGLDFQTTYHFALKVLDEYGNTSLISNVSTATTLGTPIVSVTPGSLAASLITGEQQDHFLTLSNTGAGTLDFEVSAVRADSTGLAMQAAAAAVVAGIVPSGIAETNESSFAVMTSAEVSLLRSRLAAYDQAGTENAASTLPVIGVSGVFSADMMFNLLGNAQLSGLYSFLEVDYEFDDLTNLDGLIIATADADITDAKAIVLNDFFNSGRGIFMGMDDFDSIWLGAVPALLEPVFGMTSPIDANLCSTGILNPGHPITESIPGFTVGGAWCNDNDSFQLTSADWLISDDSSNNIFGLANDAGARSVLMGETLIGIWFENEQLNTNAVIWMMEGGGIPSVSPAAGTIAAGGSLTLTVTFDASDLCGGDYFADVVVTSNDPVDPEVRVAAVMTVTGVPDIDVSTNLLDYGQVFVGAVVSDTLIVSNPGCDVINVASLGIDHADFTTDLTPFTLQTGENRLLVVTYTPGSTGLAIGLLSLNSNDPDEPVLTVDLNAEALVAPIINVSPASLATTLVTGEIDTRLLTISNTGGNDLVVVIDTEDLTVQGSNLQPTTGVQVSTSRLINAPVSGSEALAAMITGPNWDDGATPLREPLPVPITTIPGTATSMSVLILGNGSPAEIQAQLLAYSDITAVDFFDTNLGIPTLSDLTAYQAVLLLNGSPLASPVATGDVLADYVDQGGGVVQTIASFVDGFQLAGRFMSGGYSAFDLGIGPVADSPLGNFDATHPIMDGVTSVDGRILATAPLATGAQWVADWAFGEPFVATQGNQVVGVNIYLASPGFWTGDLPLVVHNALVWSSGAARWLNVDPSESIIAAGASVDLLVTFDASSICGGTYLANILVASNDPLTPQVTVPVEMVVTGEPDIAVSDSLLAYGQQFIGAVVPDTLIVTNSGCDLLQITAITVDHGDFSVDLTPFDLLVGESRILPVTYSPTSVGAAVGTLSLASNVSHTPLLNVTLTGEGLSAPVIDVTPNQFVVNLLTGELLTEQLTITNNGGNDLVWSIATSKRDSLAAIAQAAAATAVAGITPSGLLYENDGDITALSTAEQTLLRSRLADYRQTLTTAGVTDVMPLIGVGGNWSADMIYYLLLNGQLTSLYTFVEVNYEFDDLTALAGLIISESDAAITVAKATALRDFYDSGRGILIGMDDFDSIWSPPVSDLLAPVFGFSTATDGDFCGNAVLNTNHPITEGITEFIPGGAWCSDNDYFGLDTAEWLVMDGAQTRYYGVANSGTANTVTMGDIMALIWTVNEQFNTNAVIWMMQGGGLPSVDPASGVVAAGSSQIVDVIFDASDICGGDYLSNLAITNNDPLNSRVIIPADMHVTGVTDIAVSDTVLAWGQVFLGAMIADSVIVSNPGCDLLTVTGISIDHADFTIDLTPFDLLVGEERTLIVTYVPSTLGVASGTLSLVSNDPDEALLTVALTGESVTAPVINVSPTQMVASLVTGEIENQLLTVSNTGGSELVFSITTADSTVQNAGAQISSSRVLPATTGLEIAGAFEPGAAISTGVTPLREPLPAPTITIPGTSALDMRVLIVGNDDPSEMQAQLLAFSDIAVVDYFNTDLGTPTLAELMNYHAVILSSNWSFSDPIGLGDVLADYVDIGGGVIQALASFTSGWNLMGRFMTEGYSAFNVGGGPMFVTTNLASFDAAHPIMAGVTAVSSSLPVVADLAPGAQWIADWDLNEIFVATQGTHVVGLNAFIANSGTWTGDMPLVFHNALVWVAGAVPWLGIDPLAGTVAPGASLDLLVTFDATEICGGNYQTNIMFGSNDPLTPVATVTADMTVVGEPNIAVSDTLLAFGSIFTGVTATDSVIVSNPGCDILTVRPFMAIQIQEAGFLIDTTHFDLQVGESRALWVTYTPMDPGPVTGEFTLASNDPDSPAVVISLSGEGVTPPVIEVTPESLDVTLASDEIQVHPLTIANTGGSDLVWSLRPTRRDSVVSAIQAAAAAVVAGITPSGILYDDGVSVVSLSADEQMLLQDRLLTYQQIVTSLGATEVMPLVGVGGISSSTMIFNLLQNPQLTSLYTFIEVNYEFDNLLNLDGLVVAEIDFAITPGGAAALASFYDSGRGLFIGMDDFDDIWFPPTSDLLGPVLGIATPQDASLCVNGTLNTNHPITQNITTFFPTGNWCSDNDIFVLNGADWLVTDGAIGRNFGVAYEGTANTVTMGENLAFIWTANEQFNTNALIWMMAATGLPDVTPTSGTIAAGGSQVLDVTFDATDICNGNFLADLVISSNDPVALQLVVSADMQVVGAPIIGVPDSVLAFGAVFIGTTATGAITVTNSGCGELSVIAASDHGDFSPTVPAFTVPVDGTYELLVTYSPDTAGAAGGILTLTTNDPLRPVVAVTLTGEGREVPVVAVTPVQLAADLQQGETTTRMLTISNTGAGDLSYSIDTKNIVGAAQSSVQVSSGQLLNPSRTDLKTSADKTQTIVPTTSLVTTGFGDGQAPSRSPYPTPTVKEMVAGATGLQLLLLGSGELTEIQAQLLAYSTISVVDIFDGENGVPTLANLLAYNVVILANNFTFLDPVVTGNVLADYVDVGGGVIQTEASFVVDYNISGRFMDQGYAAFGLDTGPVGAASLGTFDSTHDIMAGVTAAATDLTSNTTLAAGASVVADWDNGRVFIATNGDQVVGVNAFVAKIGFWSGDVDLVLHNAVQWIVSRVTWLEVIPMAGLVPPGGTVDLLVTFDTVGVQPGDFQAEINVNSNDPFTPIVVVPTTLTVHGAQMSVDVAVNAGAFGDLDNTLGIADGATDGFDGLHDVPEPPAAPAGYVSAYFHHPEWASPLGDRFMTDIRAPYDPATAMKSWPFVVKTDQTGTVTMAFTPTFAEASGWQLWLRDETTGGMHNLFPSLTYTFTADASDHAFTIFVGDIMPPLDPASRQITADWSLLGVPLVPATAANTWADVVLNAATGTTFLYDYQGATGYAAVNGSDPVTQGQGLWLATTENFTWTMQGEPDGGTIEVPAMVGWNLVGYPLWIGGSLDGVSVGHAGQLYLWQDAVAMGLVSPFVYDYDGNTDTYLPVTTLEPWHGYWMAAHVSGVTLQFNFRAMLDMTQPAAATAGADENRLPLLVQASVVSDTKGDKDLAKAGTTSWQLNVGLALGTDEVAIGRTVDATPGFDAAFDLPVPPASPSSANKTTLMIRHPEWDLTVGSNFYSDIVGVTEEPQTWILTVTAPEPGPVTLVWDGLDLPAETDLQIYLPQENRVAVMSVRNESALQIEVGATPYEVHLRTPDFTSDVPDQLVGLRLRNVPNPFNPQTEFRFNLPHAGKAEIRVFDLRGAVVRRVSGGVMPAGAGALRWAGRDDDGRTVASGIYFYRLYLDGGQEGPTLKMTLVK